VETINTYCIIWQTQRGWTTWKKKILQCTALWTSNLPYQYCKLSDMFWFTKPYSGQFSQQCAWMYLYLLVRIGLRMVQWTKKCHQVY